MNCPECNSPTKVVDTRSGEGWRKRRRACVVCGVRFSTKEYHIDTLRAFKKQYLLLQQEVQRLKVASKFYDPLGKI